MAAIEKDLDEVDFKPNPLNTGEQRFMCGKRTDINTFLDEIEFPDTILTAAELVEDLQDLMADLQVPGTAGSMYLPHAQLKVPPSDYERNVALIEALEEMEEVDQVFHNMKLQG